MVVVVVRVKKEMGIGLRRVWVEVGCRFGSALPGKGSRLQTLHAGDASGTSSQQGCIVAAAWRPHCFDKFDRPTGDWKHEESAIGE